MNQNEVDVQRSPLYNQRSKHNEFSDPERELKLQFLQLGSNQFAIFEEAIATIADWREPTPLPHAPPAVLGVVSIQGRMLTVLDLGALLSESESRGTTPRGKIIALRGDEQLALAVEQTGESFELASRDIQPSLGTAAPTVLGIVHYHGQPVRVLDVKELFSAAIRGRERRRRRF
jgi:chemotaxis signal transduction protein